MDDYNISYKKYKNCDKELRKKILKTLFSCFSNNLDPCLYDESIIQILYYKDHIVGLICGIDNYELLKFNSPKSYDIRDKKKGFFIYNLCIIELFRNKGLGNIILKIFLKKFENITDYFHSQVYSDNKPSLTLFNKYRFNEIKRMETINNRFFLILSTI